MLKLRLPYPTSTNRLYRRSRNGTKLSAEARAYRKSVQGHVLMQGGFARFKGSDRLAVTIGVHPPDARARDLDNTLKSLLDSLEAAEVFPNDSQIDYLAVTRKDAIAGGSVDVTIGTM